MSHREEIARAERRPGAVPSSQRIPSLDGLRALSIALVLGHHALAGRPSWWHVLWNGRLGVQIFFVISGFLITSLLLGEIAKNKSIRLGRFYMRRGFRILPVVVVFLVAAGSLSAAGWINLTVAEQVGSLLFVRNHLSGSWFTEHFWSLSVEEQFYLFWPALVAWSVWRRALPVAWGLVALAPLARVGAYAAGWNDWSLPGNADALMMGALLATGRHKHAGRIEDLLRVHPARVRLAAFAAMFAIHIPGHLLMWGPVVVPLSATVAGLCATYLVASYTTVRSGWTYRLLNWPPVAWVGVLSYSLYVWQQLFLFDPGDGTAWADWLPEPWPVRLGLASVAAIVSYYGIEKPMLSLRERIEAKRSARAAVAPA